MASIAMSAAITGAQAQQLRIDTIANNISNVNTDGYKKMEVGFADLFYNNLKRAGVTESSDSFPRPLGIQIGMGTKVTGTFRNLELGALRQTYRPLDIAITGNGYFAIRLPNNRVGYTRAGAFQKDQETGNVVTFDGYQLEDSIIIPDNVGMDTIQISEGGEIKGLVRDSGEEVVIGQLEIHTFSNESGLEPIGNNLLLATQGSGEAIEVTNTDHLFKQGFLEKSNVKSIEELTKLIEAQRAFELNTRVISTEDKILETINQIK